MPEFRPPTGQMLSAPDPNEADALAWLVKFDGMNSATGRLGEPADYCRTEYAYYLDLTYSYGANTNNRQHLLSVNGQRWDISRADLMEVADLFLIPAASSVIADVMAAVARWGDFAGEAGVGEQRMRKISAMHADRRTRLERR